MINLSNYVDNQKKLTTLLNNYIKNISKLSYSKQQHFNVRLCSCVGLPNDLKVDKNFGIDHVVEDINNIIKLYLDGNFKTIIEKYVSTPYKGVSEKKQAIYNWLTSFEDEIANKYIAFGSLNEKLDILDRTNNIDKIDISKIYNIYKNDFENLLLFHKKDPIKCCSKCATIYVNWLGNSYNLVNSDKFDFDINLSIDDWRQTRQKIIGKQYTPSSIYGVTHVILNGSRFYTKALDSVEYHNELLYLNNFLCDERRYNYNGPIKVSNDLLCECALCLKIGDNMIFNEWKHVLQHLFNVIDKDTNILQTNNNDKNDKIKNLENNEHVNILFILLNKIKLL
jgi:hypothetical protein